MSRLIPLITSRRDTVTTMIGNLPRKGTRAGVLQSARRLPGTITLLEMAMTVIKAVAVIMTAGGTVMILDQIISHPATMTVSLIVQIMAGMLGMGEGMIVMNFLAATLKVLETTPVINEGTILATLAATRKAVQEVTVATVGMHKDQDVTGVKTDMPDQTQNAFGVQMRQVLQLVVGVGDVVLM